MSEVSTVLREANARSSSMTALSLAAASTRRGDSERIAPGMARSHIASRLGCPMTESICSVSVASGPTWRLTKSDMDPADGCSPRLGPVTGAAEVLAERWSIDMRAPTGFERTTHAPRLSRPLRGPSELPHPHGPGA